MERPFYKHELREAVRPVFRCEALLKFAQGICALGSGMQVDFAVVERQLGAGRAAIAAQIGEVRAAAAANPERALIGLDIKNAFGQVRWADAPLAAAAKAPKLAVPMAATWRRFRLRVHLRGADGSGLRSFYACGSRLQMNPDGHPAF